MQTPRIHVRYEKANNCRHSRQASKWHTKMSEFDRKVWISLWGLHASSNFLNKDQSMEWVSFLFESPEHPGIQIKLKTNFEDYWNLGRVGERMSRFVSVRVFCSFAFEILEVFPSRLDLDFAASRNEIQKLCQVRFSLRRWLEKHFAADFHNSRINLHPKHHYESAEASFCAS